MSTLIQSTQGQFSKSLSQLQAVRFTEFFIYKVRKFGKNDYQSYDFQTNA